MAITADIKPSPRWTAADQAELDRLTARKQLLHAAALKPLDTYLSDNLPALFTRNSSDLARWLSDDAEMIRDLLQPFDKRLTVDGGQ